VLQNISKRSTLEFKWRHPPWISHALPEAIDFFFFFYFHWFLVMASLGGNNLPRGASSIRLALSMSRWLFLDCNWCWRSWSTVCVCVCVCTYMHVQCIMYGLIHFPSTLFIEAAFLSQTQRSPIWLVLTAVLPCGSALSLPPWTGILCGPQSLPIIYLRPVSHLLTC